MQDTGASVSRGCPRAPQTAVQGPRSAFPWDGGSFAGEDEDEKPVVRKEFASPGSAGNSLRTRFLARKAEQQMKGSRAGLCACHCTGLSSPALLLGARQTGSCWDLLRLLLLFLFMLKARLETKQFYKGSQPEASLPAARRVCIREEDARLPNKPGDCVNSLSSHPNNPNSFMRRDVNMKEGQPSYQTRSVGSPVFIATTLFECCLQRFSYEV